MQKFKTFSLISLFLFFCILISQSLFSQNKFENEETANSNNLYLLAMKIEPVEGQSNIIASKRIRIINLGPVVNWEGLDYAPTISADGRTLYFVSNRPGSKLTPDGKNSHDFWAAKKPERLDTVFFQPFNIDTTTN
ncbi:MAG TPA: hypothetical protein PL149_08910, partial [Candidatus Kapabacteria bacterium]|nr:hypothetical protein [Candidatus Kapabacteria bacterium]